MKKNLFLLTLIMSMLFFGNCKQEAGEKTGEPNEPVVETYGILPAWAVNANIYEVNIRQYTEEGTFDGFAAHLPRLKEMGVDILWLMPIFPISKTKRKGTLGSYYAVDDYKAVNPEFGNKEDFQALVDSIHALGMYVVLDWVANHTGWDHDWVKAHPDWYTYDSDTIKQPYNEEGKPTGWSDVADLNYDNAEMRAAMTDALVYWVKEFGIDGYRCDVAHFVPDDYWAQVWTEVRKVKPVFLLAESERNELRNKDIFSATYGWSLHHIMNEIAQGKKDVNAIDDWLQQDRDSFDLGFHMHFTSNHDENSWNGTVFERMGDGHKTFAVLASTFDGMPLIYTGQEEPLRKRLEFFEKDTVNFGDYEYAGFYKTLLNLKKDNKALWNGEHGAEPVRINESDHVCAYKREKGDDKVVVLLNLSDEAQTTVLQEEVTGLKEVFTGEAIQFNPGQEISLKPWEYIVLAK